MRSVSSSRGLETRRWSMFDREGSSVVNHIDISAHLLTSGFGGHTARFSGGLLTTF